MSRCCCMPNVCSCETRCKQRECQPVYVVNPNEGCGMKNNGCGSSPCNFSSLVILILILLQFGRRKECCHKENGRECCGKGENGIIDNGILFIIAIFYLCCNGNCLGGNKSC